MDSSCCPRYGQSSRVTTRRARRLHPPKQNNGRTCGQQTDTSKPGPLGAGRGCNLPTLLTPHPPGRHLQASAPREQCARRTSPLPLPPLEGLRVAAVMDLDRTAGRLRHMRNATPVCRQPTVARRQHGAGGLLMAPSRVRARVRSGLDGSRRGTGECACACWSGPWMALPRYDVCTCFVHVGNPARLRMQACTRWARR